MLHHLRDLLRSTLPEAEEMTAYDMPGFTIGGTVVASYAAFSKQARRRLRHAAGTLHGPGQRDVIRR